MQPAAFMDTFSGSVPATIEATDRHAGDLGSE
jgi:hypothetical protein